MRTPFSNQVKTARRSATGTLLCLFCLLWPMTGVSQELTKLEKLQAAYLFNFSKYIKWPQQAFADATSPINLCLDASEEFVTFTQALTQGRTVGPSNRPVVVLRGSNHDTCHIRYLTSDDLSLIPFTQNTLVVSASQDLNAPQTSIWFFREGPKLRFEIDLNKVQKLNLTISSELLKLARIK